MTTTYPKLAASPQAVLHRRDNYAGQFLPAVAEVREPIGIVHIRRSGDLVLVAVADGNNVDLWRVSNPDDQRLQLLGCDNRGQMQGLLISIKREGGDAA
jgi:hypothetical protein